MNTAVSERMNARIAMQSGRQKNLNRWSMKLGTFGILTVQNIIRSAKTAVRISMKRSTTT